ncbi:MAG: type II toxin-antitoxin system RelE/ParE family toxin [Desulfobacterales bacterium]
MKLFWTETARQDLLSIKRYIANDNPTAAKRWVERLRERARNALNAPSAGRKVPELSRDDIRELIEGNYRIVYQEFADRRVVLTVFEGHRLFPEETVDDSA